jgi:hypothetical protein
MHKCISWFHLDSEYGSFKEFRRDIDKTLPSFNNQVNMTFNEDLHLSTYQPSGASMGQMAGWALVGWSVVPLPDQLPPPHNDSKIFSSK